MIRLTNTLRLLPAVALALGALAVGAPAALADQYPKNWEVQSTNLPQPAYDFLPGWHNARMRVPGAAASTAAPVSNAPVQYEFTPGSTTFHHVSN
ncbi:MAG TPA: hypothetical protein VMU85_20210 [Stellaceae bacterium]|nr:hypothetical protein [Stellaceae bacterium]